MLLNVQNLTIEYDGFLAVDNVSFDLAKGSATAILGLNGAGKSSLLTCIAGVKTQSKGHINYRGQDIGEKDAVWRVKQKIALVPEGRQIFSNLTVKENLLVGGHTRASDRDKKAKQLLEEFDALKPHKSKMAGKLSGGQQQLLAVARAMMIEPQLLLVDEPTMGLTPKNSKYILHYIYDLQKKGVTVLVANSAYKSTQEVFTNLYEMEMGRLKKSL